MKSVNDACAFLMSLGLAMCAFSCDFLEFGVLAASLYPGENGDILETGESPCVGFSELVDVLAAEKAVTLKERHGKSVDCDMTWDGKTLAIVPLTCLVPGVAYELSLSGAISSADGRRRTDFDERRVFFCATGESAVHLVSVTPEDKASTGVKPVLAFAFDAPMDRARTEAAFDPGISSDTVTVWNEDSTVMTVTATERLEAGSAHEWTLRNGARAISGLRLDRDYAGSFVANLDVAPPGIVSVRPGVLSGVSWSELPPSTTLADLERNQAIIVTFSEKVDAASVRGALTLEPDSGCETMVLSDTVAALVIRDDLESGRKYVFEAGTAVKDESGNALAAEYRTVFTAGVPPLAISAATAGGQGAPVSLGTGIGSSVAVNPTLSGELTIVLTFSSPVAAAFRAKAPDAVTCSGYFPATILSPEPVAASFDGTGTVLTMTFSGFVRSDETVKRFYRVTVKGGDSGFRSSRSGMPRDFESLLETMP